MNLSNEFLQDFLNKNGGNYRVISFRENKNSIDIIYYTDGYSHNATLNVSLFELIVFIYSK